ncbi:MAG TPA: serine/threonine protein kinase [Planctomycetaceae bacterium]|nr:serine/threonine protein kinase [Planctomycetaceae bacterium]
MRTQVGFEVVVAIICCIVLQTFVAAQDRDSSIAYRQLTDNRGRSINASVLEVHGDQVTLQRNDGRRFTVAIDTFSGSDQTYIRSFTKPSQVSSNDAAWTAFRGPTAMGTSPASGLPLQWDDNQNMAWKITLPGAGASTPIVFGNRIYLTAYSGYFVPGETDGSLEKLTRHLIALQLEDGKTVWDKAVPAKLPEEESIRDHGFAASSVAVDEDRIYAFFGKSGVFAFDHDGNQLWHADVGSQTNGWGSAASPVLFKDFVFINASVESESLVALDRKTGKEQWRVGGQRQPDAIREAWNTPVVVTADSGREELVVPTAGTVYAFDPYTGRALWSCKTEIGWYMVPSAIAADGIVYCLGGRSGIGSLAIRAGGSGDVTATHRLWTSQKGSNVSSPVYRDGHLYWVHDNRETAYCAVAATGEVVYEERLPRGGQFYASALLAGDRLYYLSRSGKMFVLAAKPSYELLATNALEDRSVFNASPAVAGNRMLIRSDKYLYCLEAK